MNFNENEREKQPCSFCAWISKVCHLVVCDKNSISCNNKPWFTFSTVLKYLEEAVLSVVLIKEFQFVNTGPKEGLFEGVSSVLDFNYIFTLAQPAQ